jgi:hypothetical protein
MIYVDPLMDCVPTERWPHGMACHLFCDAMDGAETLHKFAESVGLKREWFQHRPGKLPHYDLTAKMRTRAVLLGAMPITREEAGKIFKLWKERQAKQGRLAFPV